jgi:dimeric dUTPase (all-alpha-NTP-PPase superfamily)
MNRISKVVLRHWDYELTVIVEREDYSRKDYTNTTFQSYLRLQKTLNFSNTKAEVMIFDNGDISVIYDFKGK